MQLTNPWIEAGKQEGLQRGLQQGRHQGEAELVLKQLGRRLGILSAAQEKSIRKLPLSKIEELGEALLEFTSRDDLVRWLRLNK
jgi:predicted transposase YdaD